MACTALTAAMEQPCQADANQAAPNWVAPTVPWGAPRVSEGAPYQPSDLFPVSSADPRLRVASLAGDTLPEATALAQPGPSADPDQPQLPPGTRDGVFQKLFFTGTWLPRFDDQDLGWGDWETGVGLGFPLLRRDTPLLVTPRFGVHTVDGPETPDLPARLYDVSFDFRHLRKFGNGPWGMDVSVRLGYYSDFERSNGDAFRVTGYGLGAYDAAPGVKWVLGVAYLNRAGATVLPIGGVIIDRSPDLHWELIVPRPRIAWRLAGAPGCGDERWFYLSGEFGGNVWSVVRPISGASDLVTYGDLRVLIGLERKIIGGLSRRYEVGYVFNRQLEFDSATPDTDLDDTMLVRVGLVY
jgi:hypothetical protein